MRGRSTIRGVGLLVTGVVSLVLAGLALFNSPLITTPPGAGRFAIGLFFGALGVISLVLARVEFRSSAR